MTSTLLELESPDQRQGGVWDYLSPSRLNTWLACPLKFRLKYIDGIKTPTTPALFLGKHVHSGLERYYRHRMLGITLQAGDVAGRMIDAWDQAVADEGITFASQNDEMSLKKQSVDLVAAYLAQLSSDESIPSAVEATMQAPLVDLFTGEDLGIPLLGIVDLVIEADEGPVIADFKTSSKSAPPVEIAHEIQLSSYAYLFRALSGDEEAGLEIRSLVKTKQPKVETHRYPRRRDEHFRRLFTVIREYLDALDSGRFSYRPGWGCGMCDFRDVQCRGWAG